ncbi:MAG: dienelactone hydrolase [Bacteroidetes bacterium]|nr:dienelactone hydrolase [Bacteroidota bacterium]
MKATRVAENGIVADLFGVQEGSARKIIIMLGGSEGGKSFSRMKKPIKLLVEKGYAVLSLAYFKAHGLPTSLEEIPIEYFERVMNWLSDQPGIIPDQYGIIGGSKGAELGLLLASRYPQIKAVVAMSPSSVVWQGIPARLRNIGKSPTSSWSFNGNSIPYVPSSLTRKDVGKIIRLKLLDSALKDLQQDDFVEIARIPVEEIQGSVLLLSAKSDQLWPSTQMAEEIISRMKDFHFKFPYEHIAYNTGHQGLFMSRECWKKAFSFLEEFFSPT